MKDFHERLQEARRLSGLRQDDIADHFGIKRPSVAQWESGRSRPDLQKIQKLADLLGTTTEWLLEEEGEPPRKVEGMKQIDPSTVAKLRQILAKAERAPTSIQERIIRFAEFEINSYESAREKDTNPASASS